ncbi:MAG: LysE family translocator [Sulfitobacter sp.]
MVDLLTLVAFAPAALLLNLTPGADMMFCLGQGLHGGPRASIAASAGISLGGMVHVLLAGLGLGAVIAAAPWTFDVIRWIGVVYLVYLAVQAVRSSGRPEVAQNITPGRAFLHGFAVNLTNPKVILFVLAFVPQFVDPAGGSVLGQFLIFGAVLGVGGFFINAGVGILASGAGQRLAGGGGWLRWASSAIFLGLALRLALLERT